MKRWTLLGSLAIFAWGATSIACAPRPRSGYSHLKELRLKILVPDQFHFAAYGQKIVVQFELANLGKVPLQVAVNHPLEPTYTMWGSERSLESGYITIHPSANMNLLIKPRQSLTWNEEVEVLRVGLGPACLRAQLEVVDLADCTVYGCNTKQISSNDTEFEIVEAPDRPL